MSLAGQTINVRGLQAPRSITGGLQKAIAGIDQRDMEKGKMLMSALNSQNEQLRAEDMLQLKRQADARAEAQLLMQKEAADRQIGKDRAAQIGREETALALANPEAYTKKLQETQQAQDKYETRLDTLIGKMTDANTPAGENYSREELAFLDEPEVDNTSALNRMKKVDMSKVQNLIDNRTQIADTKKYRTNMLKLQQDKLNDEITQREHNADVIRQIAGISKTTTRQEANGNKPYTKYMDAYDKRYKARLQKGSLTEAEKTSFARQKQQAEAQDKKYNTEVIPVDEGAERQRILLESKADVPTFNILSQIVNRTQNKNSKKVDPMKELLAKGGYTSIDQPGAKKYIKNIRKKQVYTTKYSKSQDMNKLVKELGIITANDDPTESNRKLLEAYPSLKEYQKLNGLTWNEVIDRVKTKSASAPGFFDAFRFWDQDVEIGIQELLNAPDSKMPRTIDL